MGLLALTALGNRTLPPEITVEDRPYLLHTVFKNDFFAVTARYDAPDGRAVILKVHRQAAFCLLPMRWIGRVLAARERAALQILAGLPGIPRYLHHWGPTGLVREFIRGHPLARNERVADDFHPRLRELIAAIHHKGMAYVDLEKCENVLVGDDGRPYLFDFQICWYWPARYGGELWPVRALRRCFQEGDNYHLVKLHRRTRPDQLPPETIAGSYRKPWYVHAQRFLTFPFRWCRRRLLQRIDPQRGPGERGRLPQNELTATP